MFFNSWKSIGQILIMGIMTYISFLVMIRIPGKRSLSKLNAFDLIVSVALGSILASTITSSSLPLADGIAAFAVLLFLQYIISKGSQKSDAFEAIVKSEPSLLFYNQKFNRKVMADQRVTKRDILTTIRSEGILRLEDIEAIVLETNGTISVVKKSDGEGTTSLNLPYKQKSLH